MNFCTVYMTVASMSEAEAIATDLVDARLASGANLIEGCRSVFRWRGTVRKRDEVVMFARTRADLVKPLIDRVTALHSYECPCIFSLAIEDGNADYLAWIQEETELGGGAT